MTPAVADRDELVLVTGAASGIGAAIAARLAASGRRVLGWDVARPKASTIPIEAVDVSDESAVEAGYARITGKPSVRIVGLVHCAGVMRGQGADVRSLPVATWQQVIGVNLTGTFLVARGAARVMADQHAGVIVLIGSNGGIAVPSGSLPYGASKAGVNGMAMTLAEQLRPHGVRVHCLCPGSVDSPLIRASIAEGRANGADPQRLRDIEASLIQPDDIAGIAEFLLSDDARYVKGPVFTQ